MKGNSTSRGRTREDRKKSIRKKIFGTTERPRLCVFRSNRYTYAQIILDEDQRVLCAASTRTIEGGEGSKKGVEVARNLGKQIAAIAKGRSIEQVVFDRNGYQYHGRVSAVAEGAREGGLKF